MKRTAAPLTLILLLLAATFLITDRPVSAVEAATENTWTTKAPMQVARFGVGVAVVGGKIYVIGGSTRSGGGGTSDGPIPVTGGTVGTN